MNKFLCALACILALALGTIAPVQGAEYPEKPVTAFVGFAPGGGTDQVLRFIAGNLEKKLGQPVVVNNLPGASGARAVEEVVGATPDGYTLLFMTSNISTLKATGHTNRTYADLEPIAGVNFDAPAVIVRTDAPWNTIEEFLDAAKAKPKQITVGTGAPGGLWHLSIMALENASGAKFNTVPSTTGGGAAQVRLLGKHVDAIVVPPNEALSPLKSGEFKLLATMTDERLKNFPDAPTFKEKGMDLVIASHRGFYAPKGTPAPIIEKLATLIGEVANSPEYAQFMEETYSNGESKNPGEFTEYLAWELPEYTKLVEGATKQAQ